MALHGYRKRHDARGPSAFPVEPMGGPESLNSIPRQFSGMLRHRLTPVSITLDADYGSNAGALWTWQLTIRIEWRG